MLGTAVPETLLLPVTPSPWAQRSVSDGPHASSTRHQCPRHPLPFRVRPATCKTELGFPPSLPSVPGLAHSHTDAQVSMTEVAKDSHPDFPLHHVGCPVIQGERVRRGADGGRPDDVPFHLNAFGRGERRRWPGYSPRCASQAGDQLVPQLPGSPVQPFAEPMESLAVVQSTLRFLVLALRFRFDGLVILIGKAVLGFLDLLVKLLAELLAQFLIGKAPFPPHLELLLIPGLGALCAGTCSGRAGPGLVAIPGPGRCFWQVILRLLLQAPQGLDHGSSVIWSLPRSPLKRKRQELTMSKNALAVPQVPVLRTGSPARGVGLPASTGPHPAERQGAFTGQRYQVQVPPRGRAAQLWALRTPRE